jgi:transcriptional regulator with XRE-family HTH domain
MLTSELIRAARMLLRWDQETLSGRSGVPLATLKKLELRPGSLITRGGTEAKLRATLEAAGVEFTNGGQPGVRMRKIDPSPDTIPSDDLNASNDE